MTGKNAPEGHQKTSFNVSFETAKELDLIKIKMEETFGVNLNTCQALAAAVHTSSILGRGFCTSMSGKDWKKWLKENRKKKKAV